jgi:hypothetical protein
MFYRINCEEQFRVLINSIRQDDIYIVSNTNRLHNTTKRLYLICILLCAESITITPVTSTAESDHGVSWCAEIGRPTYAFASSHHPFRSLFADFRRFSPLSGHIDFFLTQIYSKRVKFQNATPHRVFVQ